VGPGGSRASSLRARIRPGRRPFGGPHDGRARIDEPTARRTRAFRRGRTSRRHPDYAAPRRPATGAASEVLRRHGGTLRQGRAWDRARNKLNQGGAPGLPRRGFRRWSKLVGKVFTQIGGLMAGQVKRSADISYTSVLAETQQGLAEPGVRCPAPRPFDPVAPKWTRPGRYRRPWIPRW